MEKNSKIKEIKAREILDSRGNPTVEVELETSLGIFSASVPSGASTGKYEAYELRDGEKRYKGKGVLKAIKNIEEIIAPEIRGKDVTKQEAIDRITIDLDGTKNKSKLGANAILAVSMVVCRAGAASQKMPLWRYIGKIFNCNPLGSLALRAIQQFSIFNSPTPCFNLIEGGVHAKNQLAFQEFMIVPKGKSFKEKLEMGLKIYNQLKKDIKAKYGKITFGDEGGLAPQISGAEEALELLLNSIKKSGYEKKTGFFLDAAANQFYQKGRYKINKEFLSKEQLLEKYLTLIKKYPIIAIEDPFAEEDWEGWQMLISNFPGSRETRDSPEGCFLISKPLVVGDDLTVTNPERIKLAYKKKACNAIIIKQNQIGTVLETLKAVKLAKSYGWKIIVSHRSGETCDDFIADLAVGIGADFIKAGAPVRGERVAKYNRLLRIKEEFLKTKNKI